MEQEKQLQLLGCMADVLKENGYRSEVVKSDDPAHPSILRVETTRNGKVMQEVMVEMCFIPVYYTHLGCGGSPALRRGKR